MKFVKFFSVASLLALVACSSNTSNDDVASSSAELTCSVDNWCQVTSPTTNSLYGAWGSAKKDVWIVGHNGTILHNTTGANNGWFNVSSGTTQYLLDVWGENANDVWAVGGSGTILHWDGVSWTSQRTGLPESFVSNIVAVDGDSASNVWIGASDGSVAKWNGSSWTLTNITNQSVTDVIAFGPGNTWATSSGGWTSGTIWHRTSGVWSVSTTTSLSPMALWGHANDLYVPLFGGTLPTDQPGVLHWDGLAWSSVTLPDLGGRRLHSLWGKPGDVWIVGSAGTLLHGSASGFFSVQSGSSIDLNGIWGSSASNVWAVGQSGTIFHYMP